MSTHHQARPAPAEQAPGARGETARSTHRQVRHAVRELSLATQAYVAAVARSAGLHDADVHAVGVVRAARDRGRALSPGELGRVLALSPAAVSALLDRMERARHVRRSRSTTDARRMDLQMTDEGEATGDDLFAPLVQEYDDALARYTDAELALVVRVLEDLRGATGRAAGRPRP